MAASSEKVPSENSERNQQNNMLSDICFRYIPLAGGASYAMFATNVAKPRLFKRYAGKIPLCS